MKDEVGEGIDWMKVGSLRLAFSPDRLKALPHNVSQAKALDVDIIAPSEAMNIFPPLSDNLVYIREEISGYLIGGFEFNPKIWATDGVP